MNGLQRIPALCSVMTTTSAMMIRVRDSGVASVNGVYKAKPYSQIPVGFPRQATRWVGQVKQHG